MTMISRFSTAAVLGLALTGTAFAADLPFRSAPPPFVSPLPVFTWTGFYLGANAGYAFDNTQRFTTSYTRPNGTVYGVNDVTSLNGDGFTGGGQIGYNYQFGAGSGIVVGVEADAAYMDVGRTQSINFTDTVGNSTSPFSGGLNVPANAQFRSSLDYLGTVRGRVGYAFDRFLVYGTGGFAYGGVNSQLSATFGNRAGPDYNGSSSRTGTGYAYGGGIEYALPTGSFLNFVHSSAVTIKAEYLHYDLGSSTFVATNSTGTDFYTTRVKTDGDVVRAGVNYKF